jgi:hypothetical protein
MDRPILLTLDGFKTISVFCCTERAGTVLNLKRLYQSNSPNYNSSSTLGFSLAVGMWHSRIELWTIPYDCFKGDEKMEDRPLLL